MRTIQSLVATGFLALVFTATTACDMSASEDDLETEDYHEDWEENEQEEPEVQFVTDQQLEIYDECMDDMHADGASYRRAHRFCKDLALQY